MTRSIEQITIELAEVTDALLSAASDDFAARHELLTRRDKLRVEADNYAMGFNDQRPTRDVLVELAEARKRLKAQVRRRSGRMLATGPGGTGGAAGAVGGEVVKLSLKANEAGGIQPLIARVSALESLLTERGVDIEAALGLVTSAATGAAVPEAEPT